MDDDAMHEMRMHVGAKTMDLVDAIDGDTLEAITEMQEATERVAMLFRARGIPNLVVVSMLIGFVISGQIKDDDD